jgi:hypothetical protein
VLIAAPNSWRCSACASAASPAQAATSSPCAHRTVGSATRPKGDTDARREQGRDSGSAEECKPDGKEDRSGLVHRPQLYVKNAQRSGLKARKP